MAEVLKPSDQGSKELQTRRALLKELAHSIAVRPFVLERAQKAATALADTYGEECLVEAVAVAAAFESNTKCTDATGKAPFESWMLKMMYFFLSLTRWILKTLRLVK